VGIPTSAFVDIYTALPAVHKTPVTPQPTRPTARQIVIADGLKYGWEHRGNEYIDLFQRNNITIFIGWSPKNPRCSTGAGRIVTSYEVTNRDYSPLCIVNCRRWLKRDGQILAPVDHAVGIEA
jgi:hypothetical protein